LPSWRLWIHSLKHLTIPTNQPSLVTLDLATLFAAPSSPTLFNFYRDNDPAYDVPDGARLRRENLERYIKSWDGPDVLLVAEAPGPNGARFSGVPLTPEAFFLDPEHTLFGLSPTSRSAEMGRPHAEYSGGIVRRVLAPYAGRVAIWNAVPLHPHRAGEPRSIRTPSRADVRAWSPLLESVVQAVRPSIVLAVGRIAERSLTDLGVEATYIRHPSQGGAVLFAEGVRNALG